jgi:membrane-bound lytic murein transglycosylase F
VGCSPSAGKAPRTTTPLLAKVQAEGKLRVVTRNAGTSYYIGARGAVGPELELAQRFAKELGVELEMYAVASLDDVVEELRDGRADIAAAHITITPARAGLIRFATPYQEVSQYVLYREGTPQPKRVEDLVGRKIAVVPGGDYVATLEALQATHPALAWTEAPDASFDSLLDQMARGELDVTVTDSSTFDLERGSYPSVRVGFELKSGDQVAWAFRKGDDASLYDEAQHYFARLEQSGETKALLRRYYHRDTQVDQMRARSFVRHIESRLPSYRPVFEQVADETGVEWRLLAAMAYQESRWDPAAVSFTGVRGMMMLTSATATELGVDDRVDVRASVHGGARYLLALKKKIPKRIAEPDRTFMALAAYNVGYGHLEDARVLTQKHGRNPDLWSDVRQHLPLLSDERWYPTLKRGYARGREPVKFVHNVRSYYDILLWLAPQEAEVEMQRAGNIRRTSTLAEATS